MKNYKFTTDNTEGFSQHQLDAMNEKLEIFISELDENDTAFDSKIKNEMDRIVLEWDV